MLQFSAIPVLLAVSILLLVAALSIEAIVRFMRYGKIRRTQQTQYAEYLLLQSAWEALRTGEYLAISNVRAWAEEHAAANHVAKNPSSPLLLPSGLSQHYMDICKSIQYLPETVRSLNQQFLEARKLEETQFFDNSARGSLTDAQRTAICTNENVTLVIAGAGTGKTETIINKIDYLVRRGLAQPAEILAVAFTNKAAQEIRGRLSKDARQIHASTLHSLAYSIVRRASVVKPSISKIAKSDERPRLEFVKAVLADLLRHDDPHRTITRYFTAGLRELDNPDPEVRPAHQRFVSISGTRLKSNGEVFIANWLTLNGIAWEYERRFPVQSPDASRGPYHPDFYLPDHDLYIEYFGIDRKGKPAAGIDGERYRRDMAWKRETHQAAGTTLIEVFAYDYWEWTLEHRLERMAEQHQVTRTRLTDTQIERIVNKASLPFQNIVTLLAQYISSFKGSGKSRADVQAAARTQRDLDFLDIFWRVLDRYERHNADALAVDYDDLIISATAFLRGGTYRSPFTYCIVDEFQDVSRVRFDFLLALASQYRHSRMFVVGDDWQSIYRFSGSDVGIMTQLDRQTGPYARIDLDTTFRFSQDAVDVSSAFIQTNPHLLKKAIRADRGSTGNSPLVLVHETPDGEWHEAIGEDIVSQHGRHQSVLMLGRYWNIRPDDLDSVRNAWRRQGLTVEFQTVHGAKGTESDITVVLGLRSDFFGFPSTVPDDPVMRLVLLGEEAFPFAEERRLFYVAITRARKSTYLVIPSVGASTFVDDDLRRQPLSGYVRELNKPLVALTCPTCQEATVTLKKGSNGLFWRCSRYPTCKGKLPTCRQCHEGAIETRHTEVGLVHACSHCGAAPDPCPKCGSGFLEVIPGRYGAFYGCSTFAQGSGCTYRRNIRST